MRELNRVLRGGAGSQGFVVLSFRELRNAVRLLI